MIPRSSHRLNRSFSFLLPRNRKCHFASCPTVRGFRWAFRSVKIDGEIASEIAVGVVSVTDAHFCGKGVKHHFPVPDVGSPLIHRILGDADADDLLKATRIA